VAGPQIQEEQMDDLDALRYQVAVACRIIGTQGLTPSSFGHVSVRIPGTDEILIKAKGRDEAALEFTTRHDVLRVDLRGNTRENKDGLQAPREAAMHLAIFRARPEVTSVIHCHPLWAAVLTAAEKPLVPLFGGFDGQAGMLLLEEGVPTYPRSVTVTTDDLAQEVVALMGDRRACLLRGHGITVAGSSVEEAVETCLNLNQLAHANYLAYAIGGPLPVPDLADHRARFARGKQRPWDDEVHPAGPPLWRYHVALLEQAGKLPPRD
jgi:ribulose-5-phosphate 4-epimerase/fuculose-1-phosphate aldolase